MNNIQEKDWAEDDWAGHSGMCSVSYSEDAPPADCARAGCEDTEKRPPEPENAGR